jgi:hypothetical protein
MKKHVAVLALFQFLFGALALLFAAGFFVFGLGGGLFTALLGGDGSFGAGGLIALFGSGLGVFVAALGSINLLTGVGLVRLRWYGWALGVVSSIFYVLSFSWWTILGVYGLWVLLSAGGRRVFSTAY